MNERPLSIGAFENKIPVRGRKYLPFWKILIFGTEIVRKQNPREGTEIINGSFTLYIESVRKQNPREGTEMPC